VLGAEFKCGLDDIAIWDETLGGSIIQTLASGTPPSNMVDASTIAWNIDASRDWNSAPNWSPLVIPDFDNIWRRNHGLPLGDN